MARSSRSRGGAETDQSSGDGRRDRWREHRAARRAEFVDATVRALGRHGADVGMDEIAAEAGVSKPVLYRYFSDKADMHAAVGEWATDLLMQRLLPALSEPGSITERIRRIVDTYFGMIEEFPDLYRFVVWQTFVDRRVDSDPVSAEKTQIANSVSRLLGSYIRAFGLDSGGVEPWSHGLVGMVQAAGDWWLERPSMSRVDLTAYVAELIWHALDGVLRSGGVVVDPDEPLEVLAELRLVHGEGVGAAEDESGAAETGQDRGLG
jgi:AcrR family transcriptional regulator